MRGYLSILLLFVMIAGGCGTENPFDRGPDTDDDSSILPPPGAEVSFSNNIVPILSSCTSCHRSGAGGWTYDGGEGAYNAVVEVINRNDPANSALLTNAIGVDHGGGTIFSSSSDAYMTIVRWIEQGAVDN